LFILSKYIFVGVNSQKMGVRPSLFLYKLKDEKV